MFAYPGNVRLLCITDDVSISVNPHLSHQCQGPVRSTLLMFWKCQSYTLICCQMMKTDLSKTFLGNKSESEL